ncbi:hypothetical protein SSPO_031810 [Streptomyces antimycoticus]|uniref:Response regulatory domain-containing protein n=1 Tax=Streptomyces antimycoticus TaxID=68175 RepID=A0A499UGB2_9ACTN|nr:hypothetical protein SSPO_031810 [Streptomyces antimycoticus]
MTLASGPGGLLEVLVVDDDVRVARVNAAYVGKVAGFRVAGQAHSAAEALAVLETTPSIWCCSTTICRMRRGCRWCGGCGSSATTPTSSW